MLQTALLILATMATDSVDDTRNTVICAETAFSRAAENRDSNSFATFVDKEARFISGDVMRGPEEVSAGWATFFDAGGPAIRWRPLIVEVVAGGTLAISRGPYRVSYRDKEGKTQENWGTFTSVWRRHDDGAWRVLFDAGGDAGKSPSDEERRILAAEPDCG